MTEDLPTGARSVTQPVTVTVLDRNDNTPTFLVANLIAEITAADYSGNPILLSDVSYQYCTQKGHLHSFAGLIRRTPRPMFSDTAITDCHSDVTIFQLRAHWVQISCFFGSEKIVWTCAAAGSRTLDFLCARQAPYPLGQALRWDYKRRINYFFSRNGQTHGALYRGYE